jgi:hypothetical protein
MGRLRAVTGSGRYLIGKMAAIAFAKHRASEVTATFRLKHAAGFDPIYGTHCPLFHVSARKLIRLLFPVS